MKKFLSVSWKIYFSLEWNRERCNWKCKAVHSGENVSFVGQWRENGTVGRTFCWGDFMKSQCWMGKISNLMLDRYDCFHCYVRYVLSTWQELSSRWKVSIPTGCIWTGCNPDSFVDSPKVTFIVIRVFQIRPNYPDLWFIVASFTFLENSLSPSKTKILVVPSMCFPTALYDCVKTRLPLFKKP